MRGNAIGAWLGLGHLTAAVALASASAWSIVLLLLNLEPNATANYLMNTTEFDGGDFWQLPTPPRGVALGAVGGLGAVAGLYACLALWALAKTLRPRSPPPKPKKQPSKPQQQGDDKVNSRILRALHQETWYDLLRTLSRRRKAQLVVVEMLEIALQLATLHDLLDGGHPVPLVFTYVGLMLINAGSCYYFINIEWRAITVHEVAIDAILDLVFAVGFPAVQLAYAVRAFRADLTAMRLRERFFPSQPFERRARILGDAAQINVFVASFTSLQMTSAGDVFVRVLFNALAGIRWWRILEQLPYTQRTGAAWRPLPPTTTVVTHKTTPHTGVVPTSPPPPPQPPGPTCQVVVVPVRSVSPLVGYGILALGLFTTGYVLRATFNAATLCAPYASQCPLHAHRWYPGAASEACPCLVFLAQELHPLLKDWNALPDVTANLSVLAEAGTLRTIQIVNRRLETGLPSHVEGCTGLRQLLLINTGIIELPAWSSSTFANLEYLHLEGASHGWGLNALPVDFFSRMTTLRTLVLKNHYELVLVPSLDALESLTLLHLATMMAQALPSLDHLPRLKTLALVYLKYLPSLRDFAPTAATLQNVYIQFTGLCCSGFLAGGRSNTSMYPCSLYCPGMCFDDFGTDNSTMDPALDVHDYATLPTMTTLERLQPFIDRRSVCDPGLRQPPPLEEDDTECAGVLYRQCKTGICYAADAALASCSSVSTVVEMRRAMIAAGLACDPTEEAWLGCPSH